MYINVELKYSKKVRICVRGETEMMSINNTTKTA